jgi:phenylpropionate dioxygenase-like ring-hydroxylating dioxygenase large terminal subunit
MDLPAHVDLVKLLRAPRPQGVRGVGAVDTSRFLSPERFARERTRLFAKHGTVVGLERDLAEPGAYFACDVAGVSCIVVRGSDGVVRGFRNACRHRGTELVDVGSCEPGDACKRNAFACRYHAWTYDSCGRLAHVPHRDSFAGLEAGRDLSAIHVAVAHGFIFAALEAFDVDALTAPIAADLAHFAGESRVVHAKSTREVNANWKLIVDAFIDGYHIRVLHRDSVGRFFADAEIAVERAGLHVRAATKRAAPDQIEGPAREAATPSYLVFPSTILIFHPDYTSMMRIVPLAVDRTRFHHVMYTTGTGDRAHFDKNFDLIDGGVFAKEDLVVVEQIQRGLSTGANQDVLYGDLEHPSLWFHEAVDAAIAR